MGFHHFHLRVEGGDICDTAFRVGRRAGRVELNAVHEVAFSRGYELFGGGVVSEVEDHQRLKRPAFRHDLKDAVTVLAGQGDGRNWRYEVWHNDGATEYVCGRGYGIAKSVTIPEVKMQVVGSSNFKGLHWLVSPDCARLKLLILGPEMTQLNQFTQRRDKEFYVYLRGLVFCLNANSSDPVDKTPVVRF